MTTVAATTDDRGSVEAARRGWAPDPREVDVEQAAPARVHNHFLGGGYTFHVDRQVGAQLTAVVPDVARMVWAGRAFLDRAVRVLLDAGITQVLDLGCGLLDPGSVHDLLHRHAPQTRVLHVDIDPVAVIQATQTITASGYGDRAAAICADLRHRWRVLDHPDRKRLLNLDQPVAIVATAVLHHITIGTATDQADIPDDTSDDGSDDACDEAVSVLAAYRDLVAPGSYLVVSHVTGDSRPDDIAALAGIAGQAGIPVAGRTRAQIARLFSGWDLVEPGLVWAAHWRPDPDPESDPGSGPHSDHSAHSGGHRVGSSADNGDASWSSVLVGVGRQPASSADPLHRTPCCAYPRITVFPGVCPAGPSRATSSTRGGAGPPRRTPPPGEAAWPGGGVPPPTSVAPERLSNTGEPARQR
jgi:S-adenosyl methyltransferase